MEKNWNLNYVNNSHLSVDDITNAIYVFESLKTKYPNDQIIEGSIDILRQEVCLMYGGSIYYDDM